MGAWPSSIAPRGAPAMHLLPATCLDHMCTKRMSVIVHGTIGETKYSSMIVHVSVCGLESVQVFQPPGHTDAAILWTACEHMHGSMDQLGVYRHCIC